MYRLLIAEDDSTIRRGLVKIIGEMGLPVEHIQEADNGQSALALCESFRPQIIVTDIRMPLIDGLELIGTIQQEQPDLSFVIISGYNDFEYARKAIQYGVKEYLLKPIEKEDLKSALDRIISQLDAQEEANRKRILETKYYAEQIEQYQKNLIWDVMLEQNNSAELARKSEMLKSFIPDGPLLLAAGYGAENQAKDLSAILGTALPEWRILVCNSTAYRYQFALLCRDTNSSVNKDTIERFGEKIAAVKYHNWPEYTIALSLSTEIYQISTTCDICRSLLDSRLVSPTSGKVLTENWEHQISFTKEASILTHPIRLAMDIKDYTKVEQIIKDFFTSLLSTPNCTPDALIRHAKIIELSVLAYTAEQYRYYEKQLNQMQTIEFLLSASQTAKDFVDAIVSRITTVAKNARPHDTISSVEQVIQYVERHYAKDITVVYAANLANMNTNYFSKYAIGYSDKTFSDVSDNKWYSAAIGALAAKGIAEGTS
ncbi:MAG TPA: response regulator, partial [Ruminiclostridium sp.]|nr:response regulator [Ruminiclostridium sp.]